MAIQREDIQAIQLQVLADEKQATENDLAVALAEVRRLRAGIEAEAKHYDGMWRGEGNAARLRSLLQPVDLT